MEAKRAWCIAAIVGVFVLLLVGCTQLQRLISPDTGQTVGAGDVGLSTTSEDQDIWVARDAFAQSDQLAAKGVGTATASSVPNQLIVKLRAGKYSDATISLLAASQGLKVSGKIRPLRLALVTIPQGAALDKVKAKLEADPNVETVGLNRVYQLSDTQGAPLAPKAITNDQFYLFQWGISRIGFDRMAASVLPTAAPIVAVVDTGVDYNHPDLLGKVIKGPDYFDGDMDPMDITGHGTHVSGIIAAINNNNLGVAGVSGSSKILAVRVGAFGIPVFAGAAGIVYAADTSGVKVMNLSWGGPFPDDYIADAIAYANGKGVLVVAAAANAYTAAPFYPAAYDGVLSVGATAVDAYDQDIRACFSNYGGTVDIAAPGVSIYSTTPVGGSLLYAPSYDNSDGTSMASPFVAGAAALLRGKWPTMSAQQVSDLLVSTSAPVGPCPDDGLGFDDPDCGRLDLYAAFQARLGYMPAAPGAILGIIVDANTGLALQGATVTAKSGSLTFTATTRPDGTFTITNVTPGTYTVSAAKSTYVTTPYRLQNGGLRNVVSAGEDLLVFIALPKTQAADTYTAVLTWMGWGIFDLDAYLSLPGSLPARNQYLVGYWDRGNLNAHPFARYLRDEPLEMPFRYWFPVFAETVVFRAKYSGQYHFAVNDFACGMDWANTPAVVLLYKGGTLVGTYDVADATGLGCWWDVFTLNGPSGAPVAVQTIDDYPFPYGEELFTSTTAHKPATPAGSVPFGTFVPRNRK